AEAANLPRDREQQVDRAHQQGGATEADSGGALAPAVECRSVGDHDVDNERIVRDGADRYEVGAAVGLAAGAVAAATIDDRRMPFRPDAVSLAGEGRRIRMAGEDRPIPFAQPELVTVNRLDGAVDVLKIFRVDAAID